MAVITGYINKYRVTVPSYLSQAVPAIFIGMPPLPIGTQAPLSAINATIPKADKVVTSSISGTGVGGFTMVGSKEKSKAFGKYRRRGSGSYSGEKISSRKRKKSNGSKGIKNNLQSVRKAGKKTGLLRGANGKFLKRGK